MAVPPQREPRVAAELEVRLASGQPVALAERTTLDLSRGGLFVRTLEPLPPGTRLSLELALTGGYGTVLASGEVIWTTPPSAPGESFRAPGMGVRFLDLDPASQALLDRYVGRLGGAPDAEGPPRPPGRGQAAEPPGGGAPGGGRRPRARRRRARAPAASRAGPHADAGGQGGAVQARQDG